MIVRMPIAGESSVGCHTSDRRGGEAPPGVLGCPTMRGMLAMILIGLPTFAWAEIVGPARAVDGDTIEVAGRTIDLAGIDAPEFDQLCLRGGGIVACGVISRSQLADLTAGVAVACAPSGERAGGRLTARCTAGDYDLSEGMVYTGWALEAPGSARRYRRVQERSREAGRGLWGLEFVTPWDWRAGKRLAPEPAAK